MLSVEVGDVHDIEIHKDHMSDAETCEEHGEIGTESAESCDADGRAVELFLYLRAVPFDKRIMQLFFR